MSELVTPDISSILLPDDFKGIMSESESDSEEACELPIPFADLTDITLDNHPNITLDQSQYVDNNLTIGHSQNIDIPVDDDIYSDVPLTIDTDDEVNNKLNDSSSNLPVVTPKKSCESANLDPVTPNANLKMLMNVLSPMIRDRENRKRFDNLIEAAEMSREEECGSEANDMHGDEENDKNSGSTNRKSKSLGLLCQKFLSRYPDYPEDGKVLAIPLDTVSKDLNVERRRIYDIVNVLESVEMVSRRAKNKYVWHGKANLLSTLTRLQEIGEKENYGTRMEKLRKLQTQSEFEIDLKILSKRKPLSDNSNIQNSQTNQTNATEDKVDSRKEKSLGVMSQKFIMLFLVSKDSRLISLDDAARILIGDENFLIDESSKLKTKVRRLYDIANILSSLELIKKVHVTETRGRKPAFKWIGPHHTEIDIKTIAAEKRPVTKHSLLCSVPSPNTSSASKRCWGRHSSFNVICDVVAKERKAFSSAPSTPVKQEQDLDESFQADFEALKKKYPDQVSSLVSKKLCNEDMSVNNDDTATSTGLPSFRFNNMSKVTNGSGPCRALFGSPNIPEMVGGYSNVVCTNLDVNQYACKRPLLLPKTSEFQPVVKKSKTDVDAIALLQQHGFTKEKLDNLMKEGKMLKLVRVLPGTDETGKTYFTTGKESDDLKDIKDTTRTDLLCQETISPLSKKIIMPGDGCMAGTYRTILPKITCASPVSVQNESCSESMADLTPSNLNDTPIKPDGIDITKFPTKKLYNSSPMPISNNSSHRLVTSDNSSSRPVTSSNVLPSLGPSLNSSPRLASSQGRYLLSWMAPQCKSTSVNHHCLQNPATHAATLHKNSPTDIKVTDGVSLLPPPFHNPVTASDLTMPLHQMHPTQFRCQPVRLSPNTTTTTSSQISPVPLRISPTSLSSPVPLRISPAPLRISPTSLSSPLPSRISPAPSRISPAPLSSPVPSRICPVPSRISPAPSRLSPYQYPYLPPSRYQLQHHDASSLLKGLTNLSPIQPTTKPNPYITPPSGSLMQSVVSGLTAYQNKMPGSVSQSVQRQLTLKTPDSKK